MVATPWLPSSIAFLSGLPEVKRRRRPLLILQAYIDESGSRNQDVCLVLAGFIAPSENWAAFSDEWQECLDAAPRLSYFKMREAANNPSGAFKNWKRKDVRVKVGELVQIIKRHAKMAIHCSTPIQGFELILGDPPGPLSNSYCHNFFAILAGIGYEAHGWPAERVDLIFDEQDKYSELIRNIYPFFRRRADPELNKVLPSEPMFRSDKEFLPLQAADMLAWLFRNALNGRRTEWEWIATELMPVIPMSQFSSVYTRDRLENVSKLSGEVKFTTEELHEIRRIMALSKRPKSRNEFKQFDNAMTTILRADPDTVKAAMEAEKREREEEAKRTGKRGRGRPPKRGRSSASSRASS